MFRDLNILYVWCKKNVLGVYRSTTYRVVAGAFLIHYGCMMLFHLSTPYLSISPHMAASVMRNRVLVPAHAWLYFLNLSRFSVDRRGHFRAVGETTTADLVSYKQKQREAVEDNKVKAVRLLLFTVFFLQS